MSHTIKMSISAHVRMKIYSSRPPLPLGGWLTMQQVWHSTHPAHHWEAGICGSLNQRTVWVLSPKYWKQLACLRLMLKHMVVITLEQKNPLSVSNIYFIWNKMKRDAKYFISYNSYLSKNSSVADNWHAVTQSLILKIL